MNPTPFIIIGLLAGIAGTLAVQWFANRKVKRALAAIAKAAPAQVEEDSRRQRRETVEMGRRLAVLEKIITDQPHRLEAEIDRLR